MSESLFPPEPQPARGKPEKFLIAHVDGGARGNPGPAGFGVVLEDERGHKVDQLSGYLGHQTNNVAEYSGLLAALEYATKHGHRGLKVVADSELLVKQIKGEYKVRAPQLQELYTKARVMIRSLEWFRIEHTLRGGNQEADALANEAMDRGMGKRTTTEARQYEKQPTEVNGIVKDGVVQFLGTKFPDGTFVKVRIK